MVVGLALAGCSARYSHAEGMTMINEGVAGLVASMDPRPSLPSPRDEGDAGACDGMDGDSDGRMSILKVYHLGVVPLRTSDAWFDQARQFWAGNGYRVTISEGSPGEAHSYRIFGARQERTDMALVLKRLPQDDAIDLDAQTPCVAEPPSPAPTH
jgi:hypothetical protein